MSDVTEIIGDLRSAGLSAEEAVDLATSAVALGQADEDSGASAGWVTSLRQMGVTHREAHRLIGRLLDVGYQTAKYRRSQVESGDPELVAAMVEREKRRKVSERGFGAVATALGVKDAEPEEGALSAAR